MDRIGNDVGGSTTIFSRETAIQHAKRVGISLLLTLAATHVAAQEPALPPLPPVTAEASGEYLPGKIIWADLFSSDVETSRNFYQQLFGWEWREIKPQPEGYGMFYLDGVPMAGLAHRAPPEGHDSYGRWIHYVSVPDVAAAEKLTAERGGRTLLSRIGQYPGRGDFAILAGPDEALFGVMHTAGGDPGDFAAWPGEWIWWQLYTRNIDGSGEFYAALAGLETFENEDTQSTADLFLASQGLLRGAVAPLSQEAQEKDIAPTWLGFVRVEDPAAVAAKAKALGGTVLYGPNPQMMDGDLVIIADPTGGTIAVMRWTYPGEEAQP